ncbi:hypothetical protein AMK09_09410 [Streptomyces sp. CB02488]|uniref:hypothetical protein n=1 Tax=Streptomyces sp. CB02488 TaxID=1703920 RepID=UPI00093B97DC|nr:hypothetical protein [Streptomyces sp. CB02488]OKK23447.1 hypothetical protein AMK09_09410 [Streptomyces sp. CB02488]
MESPQHSFFEPRRHGTQASRPGGDENGFHTLRSAASRSRRRFVIANAAGWVAIVGLPVLTGIPVGTHVAGELTAGTLLFALQCCLLLTTAVHFDRSQQEAYREWNSGGNVALNSANGEGRR